MYRGGASVKMRWKLGLAVLILLAVIVGGFCYINANLRPVLRGLAGARVEAVAAKAMNEALGGRGGGKKELCQGRLGASEAEIRAFWEKIPRNG